MSWIGSAVVALGAAFWACFHVCPSRRVVAVTGRNRNTRKSGSPRAFLGERRQAAGGLKRMRLGIHITEGPVTAERASTSVPGRRTRTGGWRGSDAASPSRSPPPKKNIALEANQKLGMPVTTNWLSGINHLRLLLHPSVVHCGREGIRCGRYPKLASFRTPHGAAASARFREIGEFWLRSARLPPAPSTPFPSMPAAVSN